MAPKIKNKNFVTIQGWMVAELKLKGNELLVYAIIYGFSQTEGQQFKNSLQYLADWVNGTRNGVKKNLDNLVNKGLILKEDVKVNEALKYCKYRAAELDDQYNPVQLSYTGRTTELHAHTTELHGSVQHSCTNIDIYNNNNIDIHIENPPKKSEPDYEAIIEAYNNTCKSLPQVKKITDGRKKAIRGILGKYTVEELEKAFTAAEKSDFLSGRKGGWSASFDWLMKDANLAKVIEGNYSNRTGRAPQGEVAGSIFAGLREGA